MAMYIVVVQRYPDMFRTSPMPWSEAIQYANGASQLASMLGWTRNPNVGLYRSCDVYFDIYNEGAINLEKVEE